MRVWRFDWSDCVVKNLVDHVCSVARFEGSRNEDSRTLHVLEEVLRAACMSVLLYSSGELKFMFGTCTFVYLS